jgi:hypothetical protein
VTKKKTASVPKKKASGGRRPSVVKDAEVKREEKKTEKVGPVKQHSKTLVFMFSVGNEDRKRNLATFEADIKKALEGAGARHVTRTGGYYIIDGKVCLEQDYDEKTENYKPGKSAPPWAGGELGNSAVERATGGEQKGSQPVKMRTPAEALADLRENTEHGRRKAAEAAARKSESVVKHSEDDDLEDFEWDEGDATDTAKLEKVADKNTASAIKRLKSSPTPAPKKKIVVKKKTHDATPKKSVKSPERPAGVRLASDPPEGLQTVEEAIAAMKRKGTKKVKVVKKGRRK